MLPDAGGASARARLCDWLSFLSMLYALPAFIAAGYDDVDFLAGAGLSAADVDALGIAAPGHRRKLLALYGIGRFVRRVEVACGGDAPPLPPPPPPLPPTPTRPRPARSVSPVSAPGDGDGGWAEGGDARRRRQRTCELRATVAEESAAAAADGGGDGDVGDVEAAGSGEPIFAAGDEAAYGPASSGGDAGDDGANGASNVFSQGGRKEIFIRFCCNEVAPGGLGRGVAEKLLQRDQGRCEEVVRV